MSAIGEIPERLLRPVDGQIEQGLAEAALSCRLIKGERGYLDLLVGARYEHVANKAGLSPGTSSRPAATSGRDPSPRNSATATWSSTTLTAASSSTQR
ncbi:MAG: hypothetical protein ACAI34_21255 [Verrucomicrobium sp.]